MSMESDLRSYVVADGTIMGLISTRMYPQVLPQGVVYPAVRFYRASTDENRVFEGPGGKERARVTIESWAETYAEARSLAAAIRARIDGLAAIIGSGNTRVTSCYLDNEIDASDPEAGVIGTQGAYGVTQDYIIAHTNV